MITYCIKNKIHSQDNEFSSRPRTVPAMLSYDDFKNRITANFFE